MTPPVKNSFGKEDLATLRTESAAAAQLGAIVFALSTAFLLHLIEHRANSKEPLTSVGNEPLHDWQYVTMAVSTALTVLSSGASLIDDVHVLALRDIKALFRRGLDADLANELTEAALKKERVADRYRARVVPLSYSIVFGLITVAITATFLLLT